MGNIKLGYEVLSGPTAGIYYGLSDHLGSSALVTDSSGTITELSDYLPYGKIAYESVPTNTNNSYRYTGKELDAETDLQYFGARYYSQDVGRFTSIDPVSLVLHDSDRLKEMTEQKLAQLLSQPQYLNGYSYAANNPVIYVDPNGEFIGYFGRDLASGQRQIAQFLHNAADYTSSKGGVINNVSGFVTHSLGDIAGNVANLYDPDQNAGTRTLAFGLTALDVSTGGKGKTVVRGTEGSGRLLGQLIKSEVNIGPTRAEFLKPLYSVDLIGKSKALIDESSTVIIKYRNSLGSDGALSRIIKTYDLNGRVTDVIHQVIDRAGKIIHGHAK